MAPNGDQVQVEHACETTYGENPYTAPPTRGPARPCAYRRSATNAARALSAIAPTIATL